LWLFLVQAFTGDSLPGPNAPFLGWVVLGAVSQILATALLLRTLLTGWTSRTALLGLACGALFALSAVGYRGAALALEGKFLVVAATTLLVAQTIQTVLLGGWLLVREPDVVRRVLRAWRISLFAGFMGAAASAGWFTAFAIEPVAHVRTLGMIELVFSYAVSRRLFRERLSALERAGMALIALGVIVILLVPATARAQAAYPERVVRMVVPLPAGGHADTLARQLASQLSAQWQQPVIVENRPGSNTIAAADHVAKSAPDGHTVLMATDSTISINPHLFARLPYDPARDFAPVTQLIFVPMQLLAHPSLAAGNLAELVALARAKPGVLNYASYGIGSTPHLAMEMLKSQAGIDIVHVPYKGTADAIPATLGGQVQLTYSGIPSAMPHVKSGRLKALAIGGVRRSPLAPEVPTFAEQGYPDVNSHAWFGLFVPAGSPREAIARIHRDATRVISEAAFRERLIDSVGLDLVASAPEEFAAFLARDRASQARAVKASGAKSE
jgi:tripartite-type tricarboxylate transporter receptor subunit TctC